ncbi:MAG: hypothetical protein EP333_08270 [Bacteroidetes bacterium]|nr:MAG: hypothetical protein EP333_08270 [Bacteroidota bacterium]TNE98569.1 MAG: hypothetical protein EP322_04700 [Bacteroidota bacterium]
MPITDVYDFYKKMHDENIILSFKGVFTADLLTSILNILESEMVRADVPLKKKKRVYNILVECFQNLYHHIELITHSDLDEAKQKTALVLIKQKGESVIVRTGNFIDSRLIPDLKKRLDFVNSLSEEGLRDMYRMKLSDEEISSKGTAGLGFLDIARKSKNKLEYAFVDVDDKLSFFCLSVIID